MHPFYGPSGRLSGSRDGVGGVLSMAGYLAFWAVVVALAKRELDARWPRRSDHLPNSDPALAVLRERFARGDLPEAEFRAMARVLREVPDGAP